MFVDSWLRKITQDFANRKLFRQLPLEIQKSTLDTLCFTLRRSVHDVARFRCCEENLRCGIVDNLLNIIGDFLTHSHDTLSRDDILVTKRLIRLVGVVAICGISTPELKKYLSFLRLPSLFSISLLQTLKSILGISNSFVKAYPLSFFDFCSSRTGLSLSPFSFPNSKEYQIFFWFRFEGCSGHNSGKIQTLFSCMNKGHGLTLRLEDGILCVSVASEIPEDKVIRCNDQSLAEGVWYHVCVTHNKPRMTLFAKYEMTIALDGKICFQGNVQYPTAGASEITEAFIGKCFDGQIGPLYIMDEVLPRNTVDIIGNRDAGKPIKDHQFKKSLVTKALSVYHPQQYDGQKIVDYHSGCQATLCNDTHVVNIIPARDTLSSLGGIACLLPLFPTLLVEHEDIRTELFKQVATAPLTFGWEVGEDDVELRRKSHDSGYEVTNVGLGTSLYDILTDDKLPEMFCASTVLKLDMFDVLELQDDKPIGLLLFVLAKCMRQHSTHQNTFMDVGGVNMISYCLQRVSSESRILKMEDESCILALLQLRESVDSIPDLEIIVVRDLICNLAIWSMASYKLQSSLYSVVLANIKAQTDFFIDVFGVQSIIDYLDEYYLDSINKGEVEESNTLVYVSTPSPNNGGTVVQKVEQKASTNPDTVVSVEKQGITPPKRKAKSVTGVTACTSLFENLSTEDVQHNDVKNEEKLNQEFSLQNSEGNDIKIMRSPQEGSKYRRRGSGSNSFLRSVNRRMSAIESSLSQSVLQRNGDDVDEVHVDQVSDKRSTFKARSMSVKFSETPVTRTTRRSFSFGSPTLFETDGADDLGSSSDEEDTNVCAVTELNSDQRKSIRSLLQSMIIVLCMHRCGSQDIQPLISFLQSCEDNIVLNEIAQIILCILVGDSSLRIVSAILGVFKGHEDFLAFILNRLDHRPSEPLRCTFFALLVHVYLRMDSLPSSVAISSNSKVRKGTKLFKAREKYSSGDSVSVNRLETCGGLASICMLLNANKKDCGEETYLILYNLLFMNKTSSSAVSPFFLKLFKESISNTSLSNEECLVDQSQEIRNPSMLISYFYFAPKLPMNVQERVYSDLLAILKHSVENRNIFRGNMSWHLCLCDLVGQLIVVKESEPTDVLNIDDVTGFIEAWALFERPHKDDTIAHLCNHSSHVLRYQPSSTIPGSPVSKPALRISRTAEGRKSTDASMLDMWFDIGMKTYATMLVHSMDISGGFIEVQRTASQSLDSTQGIALTLSVFSHLLHELTFSVQSKYKDLQRMARSPNGDDVIEATNKLENMLSIIILLSLYLYEKDSIAILGIPGLNMARRRHKVLSDVRQQGSIPKCQVICNDKSHEEVCANASDQCRLCGHSLSLHSSDRSSIMVLVEEKLESISTFDSGSGDDDTGDISDCGVATHEWMDLRAGVGYPPNVNVLPNRRLSSSKKLFTEETLNPLERGYKIRRGKMVVSLQVLRYFDMIFWPEENRLRNNHLLNFDISLGKGAQRKSPKSGASSSMTMFSAVLRTSLFVFHGLSPFTEFAEQNIRRLEQLVKIIEQVPKTCPTNEWTLIILAHLVLSIQRIYAAIESFYSILGIDSYFAHDSNGDGTIPSTDVYSDHAVTEKINTLLNHPAGKQLIQYVISCVTLLVTLYVTRKDFLASRLDDKSFLSLTLLVQNTQNYQFHVPSVKEKFSFVKCASEKFGELKKKSSDELDAGEGYRSSPKSSRQSPFRTQMKSRPTSNSNFR